MGKIEVHFELTENLGLVLIKLDAELGLAQPQLVQFFFMVYSSVLESVSILSFLILKVL